MTNISEKDVDYKVQQQFEKLGFYYFTSFRNEPYKSLIGRLIPDGLLVYSNNLLIIENKVELKDEDKARQQLSTYVETVISNGWKGDIVCIFGHKDGVKIYDRDLNEQQVELNTILEAKFNKITQSAETLFHDLHNFIVKNIKTDDNNELCFLCLALLLTTMKTDISNTKDEIIYKIVKDIVKKDIPELSPLVQNIKPEHISILIKKVYTLYAMVGKDVYLKLYQEFCKYSKANDEKNIVLTPDWIVRLMTKCLELDPNKKYNIFDPCVGTGSLIMGCADDNNTLYGCEINKKMYVLCKGLFLMFNPRYSVQLKDMFKIKANTKFDRIIMNPPYTKKLTGKHAIEFITYSVEHFLKDDGILVAIFPTNQLQKIGQYQKYKEYIYNNCDILSVINLGKCFKDAGVTCSILALRKTCVKNNIETKLFNLGFNKDIAYKVPHKGLEFTNKGLELLNKIYNNEVFDDNNNFGTTVNINDYTIDWTIRNDMVVDAIHDVIVRKIKIEKENMFHNIHNYLDQHFEDNEIDYNTICDIIRNARTKVNGIKSNYYREYKLSDILTFVANGDGSIVISKMKEGEYPLISSTTEDNGITKYINTYKYDSDKDNKIYITATITGQPGVFFHQKGKFSCSRQVQLYELNDKFKHMNVNILCNQLTEQISPRYSYGWVTHEALLENKIMISTNGMIAHKISDIFEYVGRGKHQVGSKENTGSYPLISTTDKNGGVIKYIETYDYESTEENKLVTVSMNGQPGVTFLQSSKFSCTSDVSILRVINPDFKNMYCDIITSQLTPKYSWSFKLTKDRLMDEIVYYNDDVNKYKLTDIFDIATPKKGFKKYLSHDIVTNKDDNHLIPYYSAINHDNGLKGYVQESAFDEGEYFLVCKTGNGAGGYFYYVEAPFNFNSVIMVLKLKIDIKNKIEFAQYLTNIFKQKINHSNNFSISTLDEEIYIS
jgi:type I restriction-modification system DNA methylase subunit